MSMFVRKDICKDTCVEYPQSSEGYHIVGKSDFTTFLTGFSQEYTLTPFLLLYASSHLYSMSASKQLIDILNDCHR